MRTGFDPDLATVIGRITVAKPSDEEIEIACSIAQIG